LHEWVEEARQRGVLSLLDNLSAGLLCVVLRGYRGQTQNVHHVVWLEFIGGAKDELKAVDGDVDGLEERGDYEAVVFGAELDELNRRFEVIEEAVNIGKEDLDVAACSEELCNLEDRNELRFC
jgi:phosphosulfolactate phosphohydrolase-like enzyme